MTFCIDFDNTLTTQSEYPITGDLIEERVETVKRLKLLGNKIILFTSRTDEDLEQAVSMCKNAGLEFDQVVGGKPRADLYIDDKAMAPEIFFTGL